MNFLFGVLLLILFAVFIIGIVGFIKPELLSKRFKKLSSRKSIAKYWAGSLVTLFIVMTVVAVNIPSPSYNLMADDGSQIAETKEPITTQKDTYTFTGTVTPPDANMEVVSKNNEEINEEIEVSEDGSFSHELTLTEGMNSFVIRASGSTYTDKTIQIRRELTKEEKQKREEEARQRRARQQREEEKEAKRQKREKLGPKYKVNEVVDGDTLKVSSANSNGTVSVRLIGIDAPETSHPSKPVQCFSRKASNKLTKLVEGKTVHLKPDDSQADQDKYQRLLRYVYLQNETNINKKMVRQGYAYEYTYNTPYKYQEEFRKAERQARNSNTGLWASDTCDGERYTSSDGDTSSGGSSSDTTNSNNTSSGGSTGGSSGSSDDCDPNYEGGCVPNVSYDLNCSDISFSVTVVGSDPHNFDGDGDGHGCESN